MEEDLREQLGVACKRNDEKLEKIEKDMLEQLELTNKRIDDNKTLVTTIVSAGSVIFSVLVIVFALNLNLHQSLLKEFYRLLL